MIESIFGDALKTDCDVLCHQVNLDGVMGGGIAFQIAYKYPEVEDEYMQYEPKALGNVCFAPTANNNLVIANCFSQAYDFSTDYSALESCLIKVRDYMNEHNLSSVAFPCRYGCGIANGDWSQVLAVIERVLDSKIVKIYEFK